MMDILITILVSIFIAISGLHFYWVLGGVWGARAAIPDQFVDSYFNPENKNKMKVATLIVALGLLVMAILVATNFSFWESPIEPQMVDYVLYGIGALFLLRAIGEFNYVGFFKRKKEGLFGKYDSLLFSPLCLVISFLAFYIAIN